MNLKKITKDPPNFKNFFLTFLLGFFVIAMTNAQTIIGTVTADGDPLPGASVSVKGTSVGVSTDFDGKYSINAKKGATLIFSYVGFSTKEMVDTTIKLWCALSDPEIFTSFQKLGLSTFR